MSQSQDLSPSEVRIEPTKPLLRDLESGDLPSFDEFDRLTRLALRLLDVSAAWIVLADEDGPVVVSSSGSEECRGFDRENSLYLRTAANTDGCTVVEDTRRDSRIDHHDLTIHGDLCRAYAGYPITVDGTVFGLFCAGDRKSREFNDEELDSLRLVSTQAGDFLERYRVETERTDDRGKRVRGNEAREELERTRQRFQDLVEQAPVAFFLSNEDFEFVQVNEQACKQLGYDREELLGQTIMDINPQFDSKEDVFDVIAGMEAGEMDHLESIHQRKDGSTFPISVRIRRTRPETDGFMMSWVTDISGNKQREKELRQTRNRLEKIIKRAPVAITGINPDGEVEVWNPAAEDLFGWTRDEIIGRNLPLVPEDLEKEHRMLREKAVEGEGVQNVETRRRTKSGEMIDVLLSTATVKDETGEPEIALGIIQDVSRLKDVQEKLHLALEEKANLLREVHHRVKNNLQIIKSMMNLHERQVQNRPEEIMEECRDRIQTMAMIHDMLYQSEDLARFPFHQYVAELVATILSLNDYTGSATDVTLEIDSSVQLPLSMAFPCGLIIHELVSNVCKHAFDDETENKLAVELTKDNNRLTLRVSDNGPGFPEETDLEEIESVGFDILRSLVEYELGGTLEVSSGSMTTVEVHFELSDG